MGQVFRLVLLPSCRYHSTSASCSSLSMCLPNRRTNGRSLEAFKRRCCFRNLIPLDINSHTQLFKVLHRGLISFNVDKSSFCCRSLDCQYEECLSVSEWFCNWDEFLLTTAVPYGSCNEAQDFIMKFLLQLSGCRVRTLDPEHPYRVTVTEGQKYILTWKRQ